MNMRNNGLNKSISKHVSRLVVIPLSIIGILAALSLLFLYGTIPMHNLNIRRMERALTAFVEENSDAIVLERMKFFGTRYSSSSECTYAVGAFMTTDMSPKDIIIAYENSYASFFYGVDDWFYSLLGALYVLQEKSFQTIIQSTASSHSCRISLVC